MIETNNLIPKQQSNSKPPVSELNKFADSIASQSAVKEAHYGAFSADKPAESSTTRNVVQLI